MMPQPCFTLVDNELVIAVDSKAIASHLRKADKPTGKLIADPRVAALFDTEKNGGLGQPLGVHYLNLKSIVEMVYGVVPMFAGGFGGDEDNELMEALPPMDVVTKGLQPDVVGFYRTEKGFEIWDRNTLPGITTFAPIAVGVALPAVGQVRGAARRAQSLNNIKQLLIANLIFENEHQALPAAYSTNVEGKKLLSWRVQILPFLEEQQLYNKFHLDEPWDSPHNKKLIAEMPEVFAHPKLDLEPGKTVYLGVTGKDGMFALPSEAYKKDKPATGTQLADVKDGLSNTAMIVEANADHAVTWTAPEDFNVDKIKDIIGAVKGNWSGDEFIIGMGDGSVQTLDSDSADDFKKMTTKSGSEVIGE